MTTLVVTTFSEDGYHLYGKKFIDSWLTYWPSDYVLWIYAEHDLIVEDPRVTVLDIHDTCHELVHFKSQCHEMLRNEHDKKKINRVTKTVKWSHKVYVMQHALQQDFDAVIFLDGDTRTISKVTPGELEYLSKNHLFSVHFEQLQGMPHFETGLIIFNKHHQQINDLIKNLTIAYNTLEILKLPKSWDGFWIAELTKRRNYQVLDLAGGKFRGVFTHPTVNKILRHDAGKKKYQGTGYNKYSGRKKSKNEQHSKSKT